MTDLPFLSICLVTYKRTEEAIRTIRGIGNNLDYPEANFGWFINDDGSPPEHMEAIREELSKYGHRIMWVNTERFGGGTYNAGKGWNACMGNGYQNSDYVLWLEDDWVLEEKLDIKRHIQLLSEREDVGIITYRGLTEGSDLTVTTHGGFHYLMFERTSNMAYSGNPHLRHARFIRKYGKFTEDHNPGDMEINYDNRFRHRTGPNIWRPADINPWGAFGHIGKEKTFK